METILLYSDKRVNLKDEAYKRTREIFNNNKLKYEEEDVKYYENIKISNCRQIIENAYKSSYSGIKVFILNFDDIRVEASNALLKLIEEPAKNTYFILISTNIKSILKTILSRCVKIYIKPDNSLVDDEVYSLLDGNTEYIDTYLKENINIKDYEVVNIEDAISNIKKYNEEENLDVYLYLSYKLALKYIAIDGKFLQDKMLIIQDLVDIYKDSRDRSMIFLKDLLILLAFKINKKTYTILVELKNSIRNNVSLKIVLYIFLCIILEEV